MFNEKNEQSVLSNGGGGTKTINSANIIDRVSVL